MAVRPKKPQQRPVRGSLQSRALPAAGTNSGQSARSTLPRPTEPFAGTYVFDGCTNTILYVDAKKARRILEDPDASPFLRGALERAGASTTRPGQMRRRGEEKAPAAVPKKRGKVSDEDIKALLAVFPIGAQKSDGALVKNGRRVKWLKDNRDVTIHRTTLGRHLKSYRPPAVTA